MLCKAKKGIKFTLLSIVVKRTVLFFWVKRFSKVLRSVFHGCLALPGAWEWCFTHVTAFLAYRKRCFMGATAYLYSRNRVSCMQRHSWHLGDVFHA